MGSMPSFNFFVKGECVCFIVVVDVDVDVVGYAEFVRSGLGFPLFVFE